MSASTSNLIWIDLEMTGLDTQTDRIIEIATIVTDVELNVIACGPVLAIKTEAEVLASMDDWNTRTHTESGLVARCQQSDLTIRAAELQTLSFLKQYVAPGISPMCGQFNLPGSSLFASANARFGRIFPLSAPGCYYTENIGR